MLEAHLRDLSSRLRNRENIAVERTPDVVDNVELAGERDLAIWSLDKRFEQLRFVEAALDRIAGGTYGCCLRCDEEISMKRLTALPIRLLVHHMPGRCGARRIKRTSRLEGAG
jgi:DnaK suppressor protein